MATDSLDDKVKMSLLQTEKRLVELDMAVTELRDLKEKLGEFDPAQLQKLSDIDEMKQKVEDLEDLIMVENAGIIELKNMITGESEKSAEQAQQPVQQTEVKQELPQEFHDKMAVLDQIQGKVKNINQVEQQIQNISSEISSLRNDLTIMKTVAPGVKLGPDFQLLSIKIDNLKNIVDDLLTRKVELDMKMEGIEKNVSFLHSMGTGKLSDDIRREIDIIKRDYSVTNSRLDSLENVAHDISENMMKVESSVSKFESFEKASAFGKELESKLDQFKFVEGEMRRLSSRIESVYDNIDKRLDKIKNIEKKFPEVLESIEKTNREIDSVKILALDRAKKEDVEERISEIEKKIQPSMSEALNNLSKKIDENKIMILQRARREELDGISRRLGDLDKKIGSVKSGNIDEKISELQGPVSILSVQISELLGRIVMLESRLANMEASAREAPSQPIIIE